MGEEPATLSRVECTAILDMRENVDRVQSTMRDAQ